VIFDLAGYGCNLLFFTALQFLYTKVPSIVLVSPLFVQILLSFFMRRIVNSECGSFSEMVRPRQSRCLITTVKLITLIFIALKVDDQADVSWNTVFWACWLLVAMMFVISTGVFLLFTGAVCTWAVNEAEGFEVLACAWLFFTTFGASFSFAVVLSQVVGYLNSTDDNPELFTPRLYLVHGYLMSFILLTACNKTRLA
jgi:hypothetical protein